MVAIDAGQKETLEEARRRHGIVLILAHGSRVRGSPAADSDLDIAVLPGRGRLKLDAMDAIASVFPGMETDFVDLSRADPLLLGEIQGKCQLLSGDEGTFQEFRIHAFRRYQDYRPYLRLEAEMNGRRLGTISPWR